MKPIPFNLYKEYRNMQENEVTFSYGGAVFQDLLVCLGDSIKIKFTKNKLNKLVAKKLFAIFIELAQNIHKYSDEKIGLPGCKKEVGKGIVIVNEDLAWYTITAANLIEKVKAEKFSKYCAHICSLDETKLKQLFKEKIKRPVSKGQKGSGIGLITVIRKAGMPFEYTFTSVDEDFMFFVLKAKIHKES